jgi:hypothetical protein
MANLPSNESLSNGKKINLPIPLTSGESTTVTAYSVCPYLAVHREHHDKKLWCVTHRKTGGRIVPDQLDNALTSKSLAVQWARLLIPLTDWSQEKPPRPNRDELSAAIAAFYLYCDNIRNRCWRVSYRYSRPTPGGPFTGTTVFEADKQPEKGQFIQAMFGEARIIAVSPAS